MLTHKKNMYHCTAMYLCIQTIEHLIRSQYLYHWILSNLIWTIQPDKWHLPLKYNLGKANYLHGCVFYVLFTNRERRLGRFINHQTPVAMWNQGKDRNRIKDNLWQQSTCIFAWIWLGSVMPYLFGWFGFFSPHKNLMLPGLK